MNTSTTLQALAALAVGSAVLASATPADAARGGFRSAPVRSASVRAASTRAPASAFRFNQPNLQRQLAPTRGVQPAATSVRRGNARSLLGDIGKIGSAIGNEVKTVGGDILTGKINKIPGDVLKTGSQVAGAVLKTGANVFTPRPPKLPAEKQGSTTSDASGFNLPKKPVPAANTVPPAILASQIAAKQPVFTPTGTTTPATNTTGTHPVKPPCDFNCAKTSITPSGQIMVAQPGSLRPVGFPVRPQVGGRPVFVPVMSPGPATVAPVVHPVPVAPVVVAPSAPLPVQPSCLRQAVAQDGQIVIFNVCTNQAVVGPLAQTEPQTQTQ